MLKMANIKLKGKLQKSKRFRELNRIEDIMENIKYMNNMEVNKHGIQI